MSDFYTKLKKINDLLIKLIDENEKENKGINSSNDECKNACKDEYIEEFLSNDLSLMIDDITSMLELLNSDSDFEKLLMEKRDYHKKEELLMKEITPYILLYSLYLQNNTGPQAAP